MGVVILVASHLGSAARAECAQEMLKSAEEAMRRAGAGSLAISYSVAEGVQDIYASWAYRTPAHVVRQPERLSQFEHFEALAPTVAPADVVVYTDDDDLLAPTKIIHIMHAFEPADVVLVWHAKVSFGDPDQSGGGVIRYEGAVDIVASASAEAGPASAEAEAKVARFRDDGTLYWSIDGPFEGGEYFQYCTRGSLFLEFMSRRPWLDYPSPEFRCLADLAYLRYLEDSAKKCRSVAIAEPLVYKRAQSHQRDWGRAPRGGPLA